MTAPCEHLKAPRSLTKEYQVVRHSGGRNYSSALIPVTFEEDINFTIFKKKQQRRFSSASGFMQNVRKQVKNVWLVSTTFSTLITSLPLPENDLRIRIILTPRSQINKCSPVGIFPGPGPVLLSWEILSMGF